VRKRLSSSLGAAEIAQAQCPRARLPAAQFGSVYAEKVKALLHRHSALAYFIVTFVISWGTLFTAIGPGGFPGTEEDFARLLAPAIAAMLLGPSIAGVAMTAIVRGRAGLNAYVSRLKPWGVGGKWYAYALLIAPVTVLSVLLLLSAGSSAFTPGVAIAKDKVAHIVAALMSGVAAGVFEELGWTGFAIPTIRKRLSSFITGLIVGVLWGAWHFLPIWWGSSSTSGGLSMWLYLPAMCLSFLPPYRILMVRLFDRTPSLPMAMLMHGSLTASVRLFDPIGISGTAIVTYNLALGGAFWLIVAVTAIVDRRNLVKQPRAE